MVLHPEAHLQVVLPVEDHQVVALHQAVHPVEDPHQEAHLQVVLHPVVLLPRSKICAHGMVSVVVDPAQYQEIRANSLDKAVHAVNQADV